MDKQIETTIISWLKDKGFMPISHLVSAVIADLSLEGNPDVYRVIRLMEDKGELEIKRHKDTLLEIRLKHQGLDAHKSLKKKTLEYLLNHWIAIVALGLSIMGLFRK
jgi:hypothetical protein